MNKLGRFIVEHLGIDEYTKELARKQVQSTIDSTVGIKVILTKDDLIVLPERMEDGAFEDIARLLVEGGNVAAVIRADEFSVIRLGSKD